MTGPILRPLDLDLTSTPAVDVAYPATMRNGERDLLEGRRKEAKLPWNPERLLGVGLSGGGIRSATFALGLFQGLAGKKGLIKEIDFLSTVSGGGYFGSFFGRLLTRDYVKNPEDVEKILLGKEKPQILGFLRENGRYLAPSGAGDGLLLGAALLRNWVSIHVVLIVFFLAVFLGLQNLRIALDEGLAMYGLQPLPSPGGDTLIWWSPLLWLPLATFVLAAFPLGWAYWLIEPEHDAIAEGAGSSNVSREVSAIPPVAGLALICVVSLFLMIATWGKGIAGLWGALVVVSFLSFAYWKLGQWKLPDQRPMEEADRPEKMDQSIYRNTAQRNRLGLWVTSALVVTALLLALALIDSLGQSVYAVLTGTNSLGAWLTALFSGLSVLAGFSRWIAMFFSKGPDGARPSLPMTVVATVAALLVVLLILVTIDAGSHAIAWGGQRPHGAPARLLEVEKDEKVYDVEVRGRALPVGMDVRVRSGKKAAEPEPVEAKKAEKRDPWLVFIGFASTLLLSVLFGQTWPFVNRSSHLPLYAARLTRAYLGASNPKRWGGGQNVTQTVEGDDYDLARYWPPPAENAAPIHLINVTINETIDGQSQVQQQDRKGTALALGPWGLSAGVRHHMVMALGDDSKMNPKGKHVREIYPQEGYRVFDYRPEGDPIFAGEPLPLGTWLSISGAAFSTGTGSRTSLGLSLLAGLANVRLGRWWDSGVTRKPALRSRRKVSLRLEDALARFLPVHTYLLDELLARFPGTARRHWYLSDGGHFENMGGYELFRRRLRLIVIVDGEMDTDSSFQGLANLVRKARLDFGAEVHFLNEDQLDEVVAKEARPYIGALEQLRRGTWELEEDEDEVRRNRLVKADRTGFSLAHAALARVTYSSNKNPKKPDVSWLLYIKPALTGREPVDLLEYHQGHPDFPHETTVDQFFDEAQWESYRRLGQHTAEVLFGKLDRLLPEDEGASEPSLLKRWDWAPEWKESRDSAEGKVRLPSYS